MAFAPNVEEIEESVLLQNKFLIVHVKGAISMMGKVRIAFNYFSAM